MRFSTLVLLITAAAVMFMAASSVRVYAADAAQTQTLQVPVELNEHDLSEGAQFDHETEAHEARLGEHGHDVDGKKTPRVTTGYYPPPPPPAPPSPPSAKYAPHVHVDQEAAAKKAAENAQQTATQ